LILNDILQVIESQKNSFVRKESGLIRESLQTLPDLTSHAVIISGVRRCGKSTLVYQLLKSRYPRALYLSFEDPRFYEFQLKDFIKLDSYIRDQQIRVLAFDEIQGIDQWERYVRQKVDEKYQVIITGSNASLLSRELGTKLTGRHISKELFPFSFHEFCKYFDYDPSNLALLKYLEIGGFPEYVIGEKQEVLTQLFNDILIRDIAARHGIRDIKGLQRLALYLITNIGKLVSASKLKTIINVGATSTVIEYISYLEDSYLLFFVPKFSYSLKVQSINPRKVYAVDTGLINANSLSFTDDNGRKLENMVYLHLRRLYSDIYYFSEKGECDFIVSDRGKIIKCVQVCYDLNIDNLDRELNGLFEALEFFKLKEGTIVTINQEDKFEKKAMIISAVPAHKYLGEGT
jgi:uncharacterized protein